MKLKELEIKMSHEDFCAVVHAGMKEVLKAGYGEDKFLIEQVDEITEGNSEFVVKVVFEEPAD